MSGPNLDTRRTKIEKKLRNKVGGDVVDTLLGLNDAELEERLSRLAAHETETEEALENDQVVIDLRERLSQARGPYSDTLKGIKYQRQFIAIVLADRGKTAKVI
jgi:hypothetical protein